MRYSLREIAEQIGATLANGVSAGVEISGVASLHSAGRNDLVFVEGAKFLPAAMESSAGAIIAGEFAADGVGVKPLLLCAQPKLAFARAASLLSEAQEQQLGVHPSAVVHKNAKIGLGASVGPCAVVGNSAVIGARSRIDASVNVGAHVEVGEHCVIHPNVTIYPGTKIGSRVIVHSGAVLGSDGFGYVQDGTTGKYEKFPQIGRLEIHDDVEIGANSTIDRGALDATIIRRGTKLDNMVHIAHNVQIGENVVIAAQTGISGSSVVEKNVIIAGQVGIADHVLIEEGAILGAKCGVPSGKKLKGKGTVYWGIPARPLKQHLKELAAVAKLARRSE